MPLRGPVSRPDTGVVNMRQRLLPHLRDDHVDPRLVAAQRRVEGLGVSAVALVVVGVAVALVAVDPSPSP